MSSIDLDAWRKQGETIAWAGQTVYCARSARLTGTPVLLLHGFPTASIDWQPLIPYLEAQSWSWLAPDFLGFGWSSKVHQRYPIQQQADLISALCRHFGLKRAHLLVHDYAVSVAQELLARGCMGECTIASVCFLNGGLFPESHRPRLVQRLLASPLGPWLVRFLSKPMFARQLTAVFAPHRPPSETEIDVYWQLLSAQGGRAAIPRLLSYLAQRKQHRQRWVNALIETRIPLLLINGNLDPVSGAHLAERYRELVPNPRIHNLPTVGHYPQLEAPEAVAEGYIAFRNDNADQR